MSSVALRLPARSHTHLLPTMTIHTPYNRFLRLAFTGILSLVQAVLLAETLPATEPTAEQAEHFEKYIRPLLAARCYECHADQKQQGDIRLDQRDVVLTQLVVPGQPDQSRLLKVLQHDPNDTQMPPEGKLPVEEIELLTEWVRQGAPWPESLTDTARPAAGFPRQEGGEIDFDAVAQTHWAYRPISRPIPPEALLDGRDLSSVDHFIVSKLQHVGLTLSPEVDRRTLIQRLYVDLLGMRPSFQEIEAFVGDDSPTAVSELVDRLLAAPQFGEKWARLWLDIARYADTKGYVFVEERRYPFSYTYRDYVIQALNSDKPFDQFIVEQLAADQLGYPEGDPALAAMGFLTVGPRFLKDVNAIIDDRIDVVARGMMGMTLGCARCHDHKYDPMPTADYYSLYGVFASSHEPDILPRVAEADTASPDYQHYQAELRRREKEVNDYLDTVHAELTTQARVRVKDFLLSLAQRANRVPPGIEIKIDPPLRDKLIDQWQQYMSRHLKREDRVWFALAHLTELSPDGFAAAAAAEISTWNTEQCHPAILLALNAHPPQNIVQVVEAYGKVLDDIRQRWDHDRIAKPELESLADPDAEQLRQVLFGGDSPGVFPREQVEQILGRDHRERTRELRTKVAEWEVTAPGAPPRGMVLLDNTTPTEPVVFERGNPGRRGPVVPRRSPRIISGNKSPAFTQGSGRLELARTIASPENPLTSRVWVNRVWLQLFGSGLVTSPSDFGVRTDPPSHPELLDWLASRFMDSGWSTKELIREIVLSSTYRQSISVSSLADSIDPENRLLWRQNRRRFQFEQMRDSMLSAAGVLDDRMNGRPVELEARPFTHRRSIYSFIDRNNFSSLLRTFDYPSPDASNPQRPNTTVPQQALFGLNSPFIEELAQATAARAAGTTAEERATWLFRIVLSRNPSSEELSDSVAYLSRHPDSLWQVAQVLLLTNEFQYIE